MNPQHKALEKYISCLSSLIARAVRERWPQSRIVALSQDHNCAVLKLEELEFYSLGKK
jgi:hypothetical protein